MLRVACWCWLLSVDRTGVYTLDEDFLDQVSSTTWPSAKGLLDAVRTHIVSHQVLQRSGVAKRKGQLNVPPLSVTHEIQHTVTHNRKGRMFAGVDGRGQARAGSSTRSIFRTAAHAHG